MKLKFLLLEEGEIGGRKAVVRGVRNSTRVQIKRGRGARRKTEELAAKTKREGPEEIKLSLLALYKGPSMALHLPKTAVSRAN